MSCLQEILDKAKAIGYQLPGNPYTDRYAIGVSGGADSTALAILLKHLFPNQQIDYVFTDTHAEAEALYENLSRLEDFLGIEINRLAHAKGLYGVVEQYNGFLPSMKARWCTRELKIIPYQNWVRSVLQEGQVLHSFVGIRADEEQRHGLVASSRQLISHFPFQDLGVYRNDVFAILQETVGIPGFYSGRTRSGCSVCPFMRKSELLSTLRWEPEAFDKAAACEKLSAEDWERFQNRTIPITEETKLASNHVTLPFPARIDARTADTAPPVVQWPKTLPKAAVQADLFGEASPRGEVLWVGAEFFVHPGVGDHGVWWQELVAISTTRAGLVQQMKNHHQHRLNVPEVRGLTVEQMKDELKLAIFQVELPHGSIATDRPGEGSYTWQPGIALSQMKQQNEAVLRTLHVAGLNQEIEDYKGAPEFTWQHERREGLLSKRTMITEPVGKVLAMDLLECEDKSKETFVAITPAIDTAQQDSLFLSVA